MKKRKISEVAPTKFYAVRAGKKRGVYGTWADCQEQVTGFKGASYKSFTSKNEAQDFVAGIAVASTKKAGTADKFYGVAVGKKPGVYEEWIDVQEQITGEKGPKYRKFESREEAERFVSSGGKVMEKEVGESSSKKVRTTTSARVLQVWTDGSSRGNGKVGARAGLGVYFGDGDDRNISEPLPGLAQTNQRAELTAILRALEIVPLIQDVEIITDSKYAISCSSVWYKNWSKNGWIGSTGAEVTNKDLVVGIRALIDERDGKGGKTCFTWIKGHDKDAGNEAADKLAVEGAMMARV